MQENQPAGSSSPGRQQQALEAEEDKIMDPRPLGGKDTPHKHPFPKQSMDPRPLGAGKSVPEENGAEDEQERGTAKQGDTAAPPLPHHDEVDASPEEQFTRHHVELDPEKLHHFEHHKEGPLEQVKKKATDVVRAARAAVEHHLPSGLTHSTADDAPPSNQGPSSQNNVTLQSLKYNNRSEPMHMAKVAEGRNRIVDTDDSSRKFGMKMSPASASAGRRGGKDDEDFPETLQEAIQDGAHDLSEGEKKKESQREDEELGEDVNEPEPFGVTSSARSKL